MNLTDIALNNLRRRKIKMVFLLFGMVFGVATIVTLFSINQTMQEQLSVTIQEKGSTVLIRPDADTISFAYSGINIASDMTFDVKELKESAVKELEGIQNIDVISPKVLGAARIEAKASEVVEVSEEKVEETSTHGENKKIGKEKTDDPEKEKGVTGVIVGVIFYKELEIKTHWDIDGEVPAKDNEILVGSEVASIKGVNIGENLFIDGQEFLVTGIISETGQEEDGLVFMNLAKAQELLGQEGLLSFIEVNAFKSRSVTEEETKALVSEISSALPETRATALQEALEGRKEMLDRFSNFAWVVSTIVLLIGSLIVMSTMMSSVNERTREIGIFRAIGFRKTHIMRIILTEAGIVSSISGVIGYLLGMGAAFVVAPLVAQAEVQVSWNPFLGIGVLVLATLVGLAASYHPAKKASQLDPNEALRFI